MSDYAVDKRVDGLRECFKVAYTHLEVISIWTKLSSIRLSLSPYHVYYNDYNALSCALLVDVLMLRTCGADTPHMWC